MGRFTNGQVATGVVLFGLVGCIAYTSVVKTYVS
jgi:hypothetical protein